MIWPFDKGACFTFDQRFIKAAAITLSSLTAVHDEGCPRGVGLARPRRIFNVCRCGQKIHHVDNANCFCIGILV